jgi:hypothetical protein
MKPQGNRIGWLDSCDMPARIHRTLDGGVSTVCGHAPLHNPMWTLSNDVPRKMHGISRYCHRCFEHGGKTLPWIKE